MADPFDLKLDRGAKASLTDQIRSGIGAAIESGVLASGARLPSWQDLAAQLGVSRGTVRIAYDKLAAAQLVEVSRATGTRVAERPSARTSSDASPDPGSFIEFYQDLVQGPAVFQNGVPGAGGFPAKLLARIRAQAVRIETSASPIYPDIRGDPGLRREIAGYVAVARGIKCTPAQIFITSGFSGGLGLVLRALDLDGAKAWVEDPGYPLARRGLELARIQPAPVPVDDCGICVEQGIQSFPDAKLVMVTPGQQAPLGKTLSLERRLRLLEWAASERVWVIEDDYLSELQLVGRAAPALASLDRGGRVIHIGSFSKTISPTLRLGFMVVPEALVPRAFEVAACLAPPPGPAVQLAIAEFIREGHYLRHLRRTKRLYALQRDALLGHLCPHISAERLSVAGLGVILALPGRDTDLSIVREALQFGMSPAPLSSWYVLEETRRAGLVLGIATTPEKQLGAHCSRLSELVSRAS